MTVSVESTTQSSPKRSRVRFAMRGVVGGLAAGVFTGGVEFLLRGRDLYQVAVLTYVIVYPLVGFGLCWFGYRNSPGWRGMRPRDFFSAEPLAPEEAAARGDRIRRYAWTGFGTGVGIGLVTTALDFGWRGWPSVGATFVTSQLLYPYMGMGLGFNMGLRPGDAKPSIRNFRFRMRTLMILVAYFGILFGLGTVLSRYSGLAWQYHMKAVGDRAMVDVYQTQIGKAQADLERAETAKELRAGRIPDGLLPAQIAFLKGLEGNATEEYKKYRYGLIADGEDLQAKLGSQNLTDFTKLVDHYGKLGEKYTKAAKEPWVRVEPDPPIP